MSLKKKTFQLGQEQIMSQQTYNRENLASVRAAAMKDRENPSRPTKAFTMVQVNTRCDVKVTDESRKICARALMK